MIDIKLIRENIDVVKDNIQKRRFSVSLDAIQNLERERLTLMREVEAERAKKNDASKKIGDLIKAGKKEEAEKIKEEMKAFTTSLGEKEKKLTELEAKTENELLYLPNIISSDVPEGASEEDNKEIKRIGAPRTFDFEVKDHVDIGTKLDILDLDRATKISSSRFALFKGKGARLERALIQFMLDLHTKEHGYTEYNPPLMVNGKSMIGTGQLPKFEEDSFKTQNVPPYYLIPTSEVALTNIYRDEIIPAGMLPIYATAYTPCFRSEAGAYGKDTRGVIRLHQFDKVELVKYCSAETSVMEHDKMLENAERVLDLLELPYRVVVLCSTDIGFSAAKTYDIEVWLPSQNKYREISSVSNCTDFQARRLQTRYKKDGKTELVHTLNGSGLAVGRTWVAILENYQEPDGSVVIPKALREYTGFDKISAADIGF